MATQKTQHRFTDATNANMHHSEKTHGENKNCLFSVKQSNTTHKNNNNVSTTTKHENHIAVGWAKKKKKHQENWTLKCRPADGRTDERTNGRTDGRTDGESDALSATKQKNPNSLRVAASRVIKKKKRGGVKRGKKEKKGIEKEKEKVWLRSFIIRKVVT